VVGQESTSAAPMAWAVRPCAQCPWRCDQPVGRFPAERFEYLRCPVAGPQGSAPPGAPLFACHMIREGGEIACEGWLAVEGLGHVGVRLAVLFGRLDPVALAPSAGWPRLHDSFTAMARANGAGPDPVDHGGPGAVDGGVCPV